MNKQEAIKVIHDFASTARAAIMSNYDIYSIIGGVLKSVDARIFLNAPEVDPEEKIRKGLITEALLRGLGETPEELAEHHIRLTDTFRAYRDQLDGMESNMVDAVNNTTTDAQVAVVLDAAFEKAVAHMALIGIDATQFINIPEESEE